MASPFQHLSLLLCLVGNLLVSGQVAAKTPLAAPPKSMGELLLRVRAQEDRDQGRRLKRESEFLAQKEERQRMVATAEQAIREQKRKTEQLSKLEQAQQVQLQALGAQLTERSRELSDVFATAKQVAKETARILEGSVISAQYPGRASGVAALAARTELPPYEEIEGLWHTLLDEMVQGGNVETFQASIITAAGVEREADVLRIGTFNAVSEGQFLRYLPSAKKLVELTRQPPARFRSQALQMQQASPATLVTAPLDPSRGSILALLIQSPTLWERVEQGGGIGFSILAVGLVGLLIALERGLGLGIISRRVAQQSQTRIPTANNPLGRLLLTSAQYFGADLESLVLRLEERVQKEVPEVQKRLSTLAVLAAVAPLLGLLGTVTGMIVTFQSISLYGTSDPKLMSGGISQALVTTELGLAVAIPLTLLHTLLSSRSRRLIQVLDEKSTALVADQVSTQRKTRSDASSEPAGLTLGARNLEPANA